MRIFVTGASGFIGRHLVPQLALAGHDAIVLQRGARPTGVGAVFAGPAELADLENWPDWPEAIDAVVHLAAANPERTSRQASDNAAMERANVEGTRALGARCVREGVHRVVFVSTANVHSAVDDRPVRESGPLRPQSPYAASKARAEDAFWSALVKSQTQGCVLRPAPVFGEGGRGNVTLLRRIARLPVPLPLGGLGGPRSLVSVDSLVAAILLAVTEPGAAGKTFLISDGALAPSEIVVALRRGQGRAPGIVPAPAFLFRPLLRAAGKGQAFDALQRGFVVDASHAQEVLGWRPVDDLEVSLARHGAGG